MPLYTPPLAEMRFVIGNVAGIDQVRAMPAFADVTDDLIEAILNEAGKFGAEVLAPLNPRGDHEGCTFDNGVVRTPSGFIEAYQAFIEGGWNGIGLPAEYGGQGLPFLLATAVGEIWTAANMAFSLCPMLTQGAAELIEAHATAELKARYLPKLISGEWAGTMNLTEPQAGSDLARVRTRAVPEGDHYRISGQKIFITFGEHDLSENIIHMVLARTPDAPPGVRGISLFLAPKFMVNDDGSLGARNDLRCVSIEHKLGINGSPTAVMSFGDDGGAVGYLVGKENHGLAAMFTMMNNSRLAVGLEGVGICDRAYQRARAYARERVQGRAIDSADAASVRIDHHPDVQRMLLSMKSLAEASRALAYFTAACLDIAHNHPDQAERQQALGLVELLTPIVKAWSTDLGVEVASTGIQVMGGMGYVEESGAPQHLRDARIAPIYEGTNGIQALDLVSRKVARDNGAAATRLLALVRATLSEIGAEAKGQIGAIRGRLLQATQDLAEATEWILETFPHAPARVAAGACDYLALTGIVAGGWLLAKGARIADRNLAEGTGDAAFHRAKVVSARFFAETSLSQTPSLHARMKATGDALAGIDPDHDV
ncbi:MAG: acyl-CoA dehydrogenase [Rhodospirillales bacterium]|nr:acyl-CoA dehydrogenase [Rhodospirillales bacterium]